MKLTIQFDTPVGVIEAYSKTANFKLEYKFRILQSYFLERADLFGIPLIDETMEGTFVSVCTYGKGGSCKPCGAAQKTDPSEWTSVYCTGSTIEGNQIRITHSYRRLKFCEVQVFGLEIG